MATLERLTERVPSEQADQLPSTGFRRTYPLSMRHYPSTIGPDFDYSDVLVIAEPIVHAITRNITRILNETLLIPVEAFDGRLREKASYESDMFAFPYEPDELELELRAHTTYVGLILHTFPWIREGRFSAWIDGGSTHLSLDPSAIPSVEVYRKLEERLTDRNVLSV